MSASPEQIASRAAAEALPGQVAYLGPGLPMLVRTRLPLHWGVALLTDDGRLTPSDGPGGCVMEEADAAGLLRGGHLDMAVLQASQITPAGDLSLSEASVPGPSLSREAGYCANRVLAVMQLANGDRAGAIVDRCDGGISLRGGVRAIITDVGVLVVTPDGLALSEVAPDWTAEGVENLAGRPIPPLPDARPMSFSLPDHAPYSKVFPSAEAAVADIPDGATVFIDGFGGPGGMAQYLMTALRDQGARQLTMVSNTAGIAGAVNFGTPPGTRTIDHSILVLNGQIRKAIASFPVSPSPSRPTAFELAYRKGEVELELAPQGTLAERIRAGGFGLAAFYTPTGAGTEIAEGKPSRIIDGREQVLEQAITADFALLRALKADTMGNLVYRGTSRNFNSVMAPAARTTIVEVDEIVEPGQLPPDAIVTPSAFVQRIVQRPASFSAYVPIDC